MTIDQLADWLARRAGFIDGLCITGGEPTLNKERLADICVVARQTGMAVKIDTNGTRPGALEQLMARRLVDYVAVDIKAGPAKYPQAAGVDVDLALIERTVQLLRESGLDHELRTTIVPGLHDAADVRAIGEWLGGESKYVLQAFRPGTTLAPRLRNAPAPRREGMDEMAKAAQGMFAEVEIRS